MDNDSDDARRELRSTTIWEFQSDINTFYNHLTTINERIKPHTLKDQEFQYAFIDGMIPSIREPLINWFEDLRYFHKIAVTSTDLRNKANRIHRNKASPLLSDIQSPQLECNPVSYLGTVTVTDVWHNKYLKGKLRDWVWITGSTCSMETLPTVSFSHLSWRNYSRCYKLHPKCLRLITTFY